MLDILQFIFESPVHYIGFSILLLLVCPWHWRTSKRKIHHIVLEHRYGKDKEEKRHD